MKNIPSLLLLMIVTTSWITSVHARNPITYQAEYQAKAAGLSATAERRLQPLDDHRFQLRQTMEVRVLGARLGEIEETSQFTVNSGGLAPEHYRYRQTGVTRKTEEVAFDWDSNSARSTEDDEQWQLAIQPGIVDKLSFQLLLRQSLAGGEQDEIEIQMVDTDKVETHLYRVTGTERVETALGTFNSVRVERVREPASERRTVFWLASDWDMLLIKFEQTSGSGAETQLLLERAIVAGQEVTPLP